MIIGGLAVGVIVMEPVYTKLVNVPMMTSIKTKSYPIWNIDFPAVTICSNNKIVIRQVDEMLKDEPWKSLSNSNSNFKDNLLSALVVVMNLESNPNILKDDNSLQSETEVAAFLKAFKDQIPYLIQKVNPKL